MKDTEKTRRYGWREALATIAGGLTFVLAMVLLVLAPGDDAPITWAFWMTKAGGLALLLVTSWIYERFIKDGGEGDGE